MAGVALPSFQPGSEAGVNVICRARVLRVERMTENCGLGCVIEDFVVAGGDAVDMSRLAYELMPPC